MTATRTQGETPPHEAHRPFSVVGFVAVVSFHLAWLLFGLRWLAPGMWERQFASGAWAFLGAFVVFHLFMCFFEWWFHRYMLHGLMVRWFAPIAKAHRHHHGLTRVGLAPAGLARDRVIVNVYPIVEEHQHEDAAFPWYALPAFWVVFTPLLLGLQALLPRVPVLLPGLLAIAWSVVLYEILHALAHRPYEWWQQATEHPRFGAFWRRLYGFHLMHHANTGCNEAVGGFFGLPVADWCFGTYHHPKELLLAGRIATARDFAVRLPRGLVQRLDRWVRRRETAIVHRKGV